MPAQRVERAVRMRRSTISSLAITAFLTIGAASAAHDQQAKAIYTASQFGAYHSSFCPPILVILESAGFHGYSCTPSGGTLDNIAKVLADPRSLGFVQLDVLARWALDNIEAAKKLVVIRTLACEGLWMVTRNNDMAVVKFGQIVGSARRLQFAVADGGSRASFEFLQKVDPSGLGRARNIQVVENATAAIDRVASGGADVGFFVQYAERSNPNVKLLQERKLRTVPVVNYELIAAKVADMPVYKVQTFSLKAWGSTGGDGQYTTACTPAVIMTGSPESIVDPNDANDQRALFNKIKAAPAAAFLPKDGWLARLISGTRSVPEPALKDMLEAYDAAKKKAEQITP